MAVGVLQQIEEDLELLEAAVGRVADAPDWQLSDDQLLRRIDQLRQLTSRLTGTRMRAIHEAGRQDL